MTQLLCLDDFAAKARRRLPKPLYSFISGGSETETSIRSNRQEFARYAFVPRVLRDVSERSATNTLFGMEYASPFGIAPMGLAALFSYRADIALANAAQAANIPMILSGSSLVPLEDVAKVAPRSWFQAYLPGKIEQILGLLDRVRTAGFPVLVITVDVPVAGNRENSIRNGFSSPLRPSFRLAYEGVTHPRWLLDTALRTYLKHGMLHFENNFAWRGAPILSRNVERSFKGREHLNWEHVKIIREYWKGALVLKGILAEEDIDVACRLGYGDALVAPLRGFHAEIAATRRQTVGDRGF